MRTFCITNGRIWDGFQFTEGDVLWDGDSGRLLAIGKDCTGVDYVLDASGGLVCPGLVDIHTHLKGISTDIYGMQAEMACFPFGVTAAADCGAEQGGLENLEKIMVKNVVFVTVPVRDNEADLAAAKAVLQKFGKKAIGLKVYFDQEGMDTAPLAQICQFARERGMKVMVHCSDHTSVPMSRTLDELAQGDILTHIYHGGPCSALAEDFTGFQKARERGVVLDTGSAGNVHTSICVLRKAMEKGFVPDTISSDITRLSAFIRGGLYGLTMCMSMFRTLGMPEEHILRRVTTDAASALGQNWGRLEAGGTADIAVLHYGHQPYSLTDAEGNTLADQNGYQCTLTVSEGQIVYRCFERGK